MRLGDSPFLCNSGGSPLCPPGYECRQGRCVKKGVCPSASPLCGRTEAGGPLVDAGPPEAGKPPPPDSKAWPPDSVAWPPDSKPWPPDQKTWPQDMPPPPPDMPPPPPDMPPPPPDMPQPKPDLPPTAGGYGATCGGIYPGCKPGFTCMAIPGHTPSFCTVKCPSIGQTCSGTPGNTHAKCVLKDSGGQLWCAFICAYNMQKWPCPNNMTCAKLPNPPTSLQYPCMP